jgi:hypothetical protein
MNILLWLLQILLALHTAAGAMFKFSHTPLQTNASLKMIPTSGWLAMSILELLCSLALIVPAFRKPLGILVPMAAIYIAAEMVLFTGLSLSSGHADSGSITYWLVVAAVCAFIAYGRFGLKPLVGALVRGRGAS